MYIALDQGYVLEHDVHGALGMISWVSHGKAAIVAMFGHDSHEARF